MQIRSTPICSRSSSPRSVPLTTSSGCDGEFHGPQRASRRLNTNTTVLNAKPFIRIAALVVCAPFSGPVKAYGHQVTVKISVGAAGLDLSQPADAREVSADFPLPLGPLAVTATVSVCSLRPAWRLATKRHSGIPFVPSIDRS
jgi:hypothetical protein